MADGLNEYGVELARVKVGAVVRFEGEDDSTVLATVVRLDSPTFGVVDCQPEHQQGETYRCFFSANNVIAIVKDAS